MKHRNVFISSLGCSKNTVDSDSMAQLLLGEGYRLSQKPEKADVLIVNTCGFIETARAESIDILSQLDSLRKPGSLLIAAGCFSQRDGAGLVAQVPGLDGIIGTRRWMDILSLVDRLGDRSNPAPLYHLPGDALTVGTDEGDVIRASIQGASAYLKIADGCRRPCGFCAIPLIKGTLISRPRQRILEEAKILNDEGIQELILIAQDTTDYGHDRGEKDGLASLLEGILPVIPDIPWVRIMYSYPGYITDTLIDLMASETRLLPYLDIPLQHGSSEVLRRMRRPSDVDWVYKTISKMRDRIPGLAIRSTFIVGYPGETEDEYLQLEQLVSDLAFDRVGVFTYSYEPGTPSSELPGQLPEDLKQERLDRLMRLQQGISLKKNQSFIGQDLDVLVDGYGDGLSIARSYRDAPEIDGLVLVEGRLPVGQIVPVTITGAMEYDLAAIPLGSR